MKITLSIILIVCMLFSLSACGSRKNTEEENDTNVTSQTDIDLEDEPPFSLDAKPVDGKEYIGDGFAYILYDDNSVEIMSYTGNKAEILIPSKINDYLVSRIAASAFEDCTFLKEINIWADVIAIGESAFKGCTSLQEISIPSSVSEIYDSTFEDCANLEETNIWGDVVRIGVNAFKNCVSLKEISIPSSCLLVDKSAFEGCTNMEEVNFWGGEIIGEYAFKNCISLKEISIPSEVTVIKESAFEGCKSLKEIIVWGDNVTFGVNVFANCPKLEELPDGAYPDGVYSDDKSNTSQNDSKNDNDETDNDTSSNESVSQDDDDDDNNSTTVLEPYDGAVKVCQKIKDSLNNPDSLQLHEILHVTYNGCDYYYIDLSAMNKMGGYTRTRYYAMYMDGVLFKLEEMESFSYEDIINSKFDDLEYLDVSTVDSRLK